MTESLADMMKDAQSCGARCRRCEGDIEHWRHTGKPSLCWRCESLNSDPDYVFHAKYLRCPACGDRAEAQPYDIPDIDQSFDVRCNACGQEYEVGVSISVEYMSPPLLDTLRDRAQGGE